jgi:type I restriction enzyme M protein
VEGLEGIFGNSGIWRNKNILTDETITALIENFSALDLSLASCPADEMGNAYEHLIGKFADDAGNTAQEFYTNRTVVDLMVEILEPKAQESIYDPTCGTGGMLISCIAKLKNPDNPNDNSWREIRAYGQELKPLTATIARTNLFLHGVEEFRIVKDDTLTRPAFTSGGKLQTFDVVLANPPYSIKHWNRDLFMNDPYGRNFLGTPPQGRADYAFIQHILKSMDPEKGRCAILLPHGVLFRDEEQEIRKKLVDSDLLDCVIGLGPNLFYNASMEACIMICNSKKPSHKVGKVLFIDAKKEVERKNAQSRLAPGHIQKILSAYRDYESIDHFSYVATVDEIRSQGCNIAIQMYVTADESASDRRVDLKSAVLNWEIGSLRTSGCIDELVKMF